MHIINKVLASSAVIYSTAVLDATIKSISYSGWNFEVIARINITRGILALWPFSAKNEIQPDESLVGTIARNLAYKVTGSLVGYGLSELIDGGSWVSAVFGTFAGITTNVIDHKFVDYFRYGRDTFNFNFHQLKLAISEGITTGLASYLLYKINHEDVNETPELNQDGMSDF